MSEKNGKKKSKKMRAAEKRAQQGRREAAGETIRHNVQAARSSWREAERVAEERSALTREGAELAPSRQVRRNREQRRDGLEERAVRLLVRDDEYIQSVLNERKKVDGASCTPPY